MIRFLIGLVLVYGAADWVDRGGLVNALLCVVVGAALMHLGARAARRKHEEYGS